MPLVHSILYRRCTGGIGFALIVTVLSPIKTQDYTHVFFLLPCILYHSLHEIRTKKPTDGQTFVYKTVDFEPPKTGTRHIKVFCFLDDYIIQFVLQYTSKSIVHKMVEMAQWSYCISAPCVQNISVLGQRHQANRCGFQFFCANSQKILTSKKYKKSK